MSETIRHTIFQHNTISSLASGVFDDDLTIAELLGHGSFGIGTFNKLDGEMIIIDGTCYQMRIDGTVEKASLDTKTPYAVVTNFVPSLRIEDVNGMERSDVSKIIGNILPSPNYVYALRITGEFDWVTYRAVQKQERPYPSLVEATDGEEIKRFENVSGSMVGFRTPEFQATIAVPGCHIHFIDDDHTIGGHVVDFAVKNAVAEICIGTDMQLRLPLTRAFMEAHLTPDDLQEQLDKAEHSSSAS
ncbi:MAG: acetolactate decarboxylase [Corynebacterium sp.]|nr:acetolactate decarboxylase [Corynebacterium sp.]